MKKNIKFIALCLVSSMITVQSYAQIQQEIKSRVLNDFNQPIVGATIRLEGDDLQLLTDD